jgi:hypothetical protein
MNTKASTGRNKKACLSRYCERLELRAQYVYETDVLSFMFNTIANGGNVIIINKKGESRHWFLPGWKEEEEKPQ